jgi:cell division protein FtsB
MFSVSKTGPTRELVQKQLDKLLEPTKKIEAYVNNVMLAEDALAKDFINPRAHIAKKFGLSYDGEILRRFVKDSQTFKDNKKIIFTFISRISETKIFI